MALTELLQSNAIVSIIIISIIVTFISSLLTKWLTNQEHLKGLKERQKLLQAEMKKHKDNPQKMQEIQTEILKITGTMMKSSFKPMLVTFIPFLILAYWINSVYLDVIGKWWILYYLIASLIASVVFRKLLKMA